MARWYPESDNGPYVDVAAFAEANRPPQIPAPLIRGPVGTTIIATVLNDLRDSVVWTHGLASGEAALDSVPIEPGETHTFSFIAGTPGTYLYSASPGHVDRGPVARRSHEREQLSGALVVDGKDARPDDRIFVINIWGDRIDPTTYRNVLAINGKSWPYTERISAVVGDSARWRVVNGSERRHPMHMHGFYYRVDSRGDIAKDTVYSADARPVVVTADMAPGTTMSMTWSPDRTGNWLFHCHLAFHVLGRSRLDGADDQHLTHGADLMKHMAGLVLGMNVKPRNGAALRAEVNWARDARKLHLFANERPRALARTPLAMSFVLQRDGRVPAADSVEPPGQPIVLTRNEPTQITVVNRTHEGTSVHWHGIELESYSDGVPGWSGAADNLAPMIFPKDSFIARLTLPRAGTFIYHTHLNDIEQLTSGMYGPLIVLERGEKFDPSRDHVLTIGWDGPDIPSHVLINGDSIPGPVTLASGFVHRLRFINIGPAGLTTVSIRRDTSVVGWLPHAKDGADLPAMARKKSPAITTLNVGETFDADFDPPPGEYVMTFEPPPGVKIRTKRIIVR
jgi:FtsP/CotA-like multicopper oxidase with cupredoxin domain